MCRTNYRRDGRTLTVVGSELSIDDTADLSLASRSTVLNMRRVRKALQQGTAAGYLGTLDWPTARAKYANNDIEFGNGDWQEKQARIIAEKLEKTFGNELSRFPRILWKALERYDSNLIYAFCEEYGIDPDLIDIGTDTEWDPDLLDGEPDF